MIMQWNATTTHTSLILLLSAIKVFKFPTNTHTNQQTNSSKTRSKYTICEKARRDNSGGLMYVWCMCGLDSGATRRLAVSRLMWWCVYGVIRASVVFLITSPLPPCTMCAAVMLLPIYRHHPSAFISNPRVRSHHYLNERPHGSRSQSVPW